MIQPASNRPDRHGAALVGRNGSIDWLCLPRFDAPAQLAGLLGADCGHFRVAPSSAGTVEVERRYVPDLDAAVLMMPIVGFLPADDPGVLATLDAIEDQLTDANGNDVGLLSEQVAADGTELLGNFPQAFSHIGLVNAAHAIQQAERQRR